MWNPLKKNRNECEEVLYSLEDVSGQEGLPKAQREHAAACAHCGTAVEEWTASRELLKALPRQADEARPWFAARVMAAIAARESETRRTLDAWVIIPKLAVRLTWASALALALASTWLLEQPATTPPKPVVTDITGEPVVERVAPVNNDELLLSLVEKGS